MAKSLWDRFVDQMRTPLPVPSGSDGQSGQAEPSQTSRSGVWEDAGPTKVSSWVAANGTPGRRFSFDWCRFRRNSHCYFSDIVDAQASQEAGHAVLVPVDRGYCWRSAWETQQKCDAAQPGPRAAEGLFQSSRPAFTDATVPWEAGGQRGDGSKVTYTPPGSAGGLGIIGKGAPASLGDDERDTPTPNHPFLANSYAPTQTLNPSQRARAVGDLVQLRTGGFLSYNEYVELRSRVDAGRRIVTEAAPLGDHDATTSAVARVDTLRQVGILTVGEHQGLSRRV